MDEELLRQVRRPAWIQARAAKIEARGGSPGAGLWQGLTFFHLENWDSAPSIIRKALKLSGLYWRALRIADRIVIRRNDVAFHNLPSSFTDFTILHLSDLHVDQSAGAMQRLVEIVGTLTYDICVLN